MKTIYLIIYRQIFPDPAGTVIQIIPGSKLVYFTGSGCDPIIIVMISRVDRTDQGLFKDRIFTDGMGDKSQLIKGMHKPHSRGDVFGRECKAVLRR
jgi:hypothetical protein